MCQLSEEVLDKRERMIEELAHSLAPAAFFVTPVHTGRYKGWFSCPPQAEYYFHSFKGKKAYANDKLYLCPSL